MKKKKGKIKSIGRKMGLFATNPIFSPQVASRKLGFFCRIRAHFLSGVSPELEASKRVRPANYVAKRVATRWFTCILVIIFRFLAICFKHLPTRRPLRYL